MWCSPRTGIRRGINPSRPPIPGVSHTRQSPSLGDIRARAARDLERLPETLHRLELGASYPVEVARALVRLGTEVDGRLARQDKAPS